ncbi:MAG: Ig-like domain-containing protein [Bacillota bacterium]
MRSKLQHKGYLFVKLLLVLVITMGTLIIVPTGSAVGEVVVQGTTNLNISKIVVNGKTLGSADEISFTAVKDTAFNMEITLSGTRVTGFDYYYEIKLEGNGQEKYDKSKFDSNTITYATTVNESTNYQVTVKIYETDSEGNETYSKKRDFICKIGYVDNVAPKVSSRYPLPGAVNIPVKQGEAVIQIKLSENVDPATVNNNTVYLREKINNTTTKMSEATITIQNNIIKLTPNKDLKYSTDNAVYTVVIENNAIKDFAGNPLPGETWDFTTIPNPNAAPTITSRSPSSGATGVKTTTDILIKLSKKLDMSSVSASGIYLKDTSGKIPITILARNINELGEITLSPNSALNYGSVYTVVIENNIIKDVNGKSLVGISWSFTTEAGSLLSITSRYPQANASNVNVDDVISVTFNNRLDTSTVTNSNIYLRRTGSSANIAATLSYSATNRTVTISPSNPLAYNTEYTVYISNNLKDVNGNKITTTTSTATSWKFTTEEEDLVGISDRSPKPNSTNIAVDTDIIIKFAQAMDTSTLTTSNVYLRKSGTSRNISSSLSYSSSTRTLTLTPDSNLDYDTDYIVYITSSVKDNKGNRMSTTSWRFTTKEEDPVYIVERNPAANSTNQAVDSTITIRFSQPMDRTTLTTSNIYMRKSGTTRNISVDLDYNSSRRTVTLTPVSNLDYNTEYVIYVSNKVKDTDGNTITSTQWKFSTTAGEPLKVLYNIPANNQKDFPVNESIFIIFTRELLASSVNTANVLVRNNNTNSYAPIILTYTNSDKKLVIKPQSKWDYDTSYTIYLTSGIKDDTGKSLTATTLTFSTQKEVIRYGTPASPELRVSGRYVDFTDARPLVKDGRTFLPFRALFEAVGANVGYDFSNSQRLKVWGELSGNKVEFYVGDLKAYRNGTIIYMDVKPELIDGRTMIPVRFAAEALGLRVNWDPASNNIIIE